MPGHQNIGGLIASVKDTLAVGNVRVLLLCVVKRVDTRTTMVLATLATTNVVASAKSPSISDKQANVSAYSIGSTI
jgi:hypothetical protein